MKINSNMQALQASGILQTNESAFSKSSARLSSGYKINISRDDPVGMAISNVMDAKTSSLRKANINSTSGVSVVQTADGALAEMRDIVHRLKELAIHSANGTNTDEDRQAMQAEMDQLTEEMERIRNQTEYNNQKLLNGDLGVKGGSYVNEIDPVTGNTVLSTRTGLFIGSYNNHAMEGTGRTLLIEDDENGVPQVKSFVGFPEGKNGKFTTDPLSQTFTYTDDDGNELVLNYTDNLVKDKEINLDVISKGDMTIQVGNTEGQEIKITIPDVSLENMGIKDLDISSQESAKKAMSLCDDAFSYLSRVSSRIGVIQNRFEANISNLNVSEENLTASFATIRDTDMAAEMIEYTKNQLLTQAGVSILSQANELPQQALQLLQ